MRKETKIGIIIGIIIVVGVAVYFANQDKNSKPAIPDNMTFDDPSTVQPTTTVDPKPETTADSTDINSPAISDPGPLTADNSDSNEENTVDVSIPDEVDELTTVDNKDDIVIAMPKKDIEPEPTVTKAINDDPLANLPNSYPEQMTERKYHTVQKGDSLYSISTEYFGTGKYWKKIYDVNKDIIKNESSLTIGWKLKIPTPEEME